jgi:tungstate transport system permease protein
MLYGAGMIDLGQSAILALELILRLDPEFVGIVLLSLRVSLTASVIAFVIGTPLGALLAMARFRGRSAVLVVTNAALGLPPVVVGLIVYLLLSRAGPLGSWGLLFTPAAMIVAQALLAIPIVTALVHRLCEGPWAQFGDALRVDGASRIRSAATILALSRAGLVTVFLSAFGRAIAEVGAILVVGGNIRGYTRTMTTAIALETSRGDLPLALGLGLVLVAITIAVSAVAFSVGRWAARR